MATIDKKHGEGGAAAAGFPMEHEICFSREHTALLVIDPVNDLLSEGGAGWDETRWTLQVHDVVGRLRRALDGARQRGIPVIFGPMAYREEDYAEEGLQRRSGINRFMFERKMFLAGSWGADFHPDLQPTQGDIVLAPHKGMDVFETDLPDQLERLGTTHLVIAGMTANLCCESTGRRAMELGYDVTYLADAIGASSLMAYEAAVHLNYPFIANAVMTVEEFLASAETGAAEAAEVRPGDMLRGSDHGEIGEVNKVVAATEVTEAYLLVTRGVLFLKDAFVPLDAVVKRCGRDVFINVPKPAVAAMPWGAPPSRTERKAMQGLRSGEVEKPYGSGKPSAPRRPPL